MYAGIQGSNVWRIQTSAATPPSPSQFSLSLPATPIAANFGLNADLQMQIWAPCKGSVLHIRIFTLFLGRFYVLKNMKFANYK